MQSKITSYFFFGVGGDFIKCRLVGLSLIMIGQFSSISDIQKEEIYLYLFYHTDNNWHETIGSKTNSSLKTINNTISCFVT